MSDLVIVAVLSLVGTAIGAFAGIMAANKLSNYRIDQLEKKVDKHNSVIERVAVLERDCRTSFCKIDELRTDLHELTGIIH